jgi:hypothetical protein
MSSRHLERPSFSLHHTIGVSNGPGPSSPLSL